MSDDSKLIGGRYREIHKIGSGGMSVVILAEVVSAATHSKMVSSPGDDPILVVHDPWVLGSKRARTSRGDMPSLIAGSASAASAREHPADAAGSASVSAMPSASVET